MAPAWLGESNQRKLGPPRARPPARDRNGDYHDFRGLVRGRVDLELVFAFAEAEEGFGQDCTG